MSISRVNVEKREENEEERERERGTEKKREAIFARRTLRTYVENNILWTLGPAFPVSARFFCFLLLLSSPLTLSLSRA